MTNYTSLAFAATILLTTSATAGQWSAEKTAFLEQKIAKYIVGPKSAPSIAYGVTINGEPAAASGVGLANKVTGEKATAFTHYQIGSLSKQLTAAAVLGMIEDKSGQFASNGTAPAGKFTLDTPLTNIFEDSAYWMPKGTITLRHLLNMNAGLAEYTSLPQGANGVPDKTAPISKPALFDLIRLLFKVTPANVPPGKAYKYTNTNYYLLSVAIERMLPPNIQAKGTSYRDYLRHRVFVRAGMTATGFLDDYPTPGGMAVPPYDTKNAQVNKPAWPQGAGEVTSNVTDMLKWHKALMNDKIFSVGARAAMFKPGAMLSANTYYAMGWQGAAANAIYWYTHNGKIAGYSSFDGILVDKPKNFWASAVFFANNDDIDLSALTACAVQLATDNATSMSMVNAIALSVCAKA